MENSFCCIPITFYTVCCFLSNKCATVAYLTPWHGTLISSLWDFVDQSDVQK